MKAVGPLVVGDRPLPAWLGRVLVLVPAALLAALVAVQTVGADGGIVIDARAAGVAAAAVAVMLRAPVVVVILVGMAAAALLRAAGVG